MRRARSRHTLKKASVRFFCCFFLASLHAFVESVQSEQGAGPGPAAGAGLQTRRFQTPPGDVSRLGVCLTPPLSYSSSFLFLFFFFYASVPHSGPSHGYVGDGSPMSRPGMETLRRSPPPQELFFFDCEVSGSRGTLPLPFLGQCLRVFLNTRPDPEPDLWVQLWVEPPGPLRPVHPFPLHPPQPTCQKSSS